MRCKIRDIFLNSKTFGRFFAEKKKKFRLQVKIGEAWEGNNAIQQQRPHKKKMAAMPPSYLNLIYILKVGVDAAPL